LLNLLEKMLGPAAQLVKLQASLLILIGYAMVKKIFGYFLYNTTLIFKKNAK